MAMNFRELLQLILEDTKQDALATELGTSQSTVSRWIKGAEPGGEMVERIREAAQRRGLVSQEAQQPAGDVALLDLRVGMGNGGLMSIPMDARNKPVRQAVLGHWSFPEQVKAGWRRLDSVYALPVTGDSMEPTLANGSYVFVDTTHIVPSPEDIYAIDCGDGLMVKRIAMIPRTDKIRVISDNDRYEPYELFRDEVTIYGRVVAWFQWRG
jgi:transposase-like protein